MKGLAQRGSNLDFGSFGIKALEECWMTSRQIEAAVLRDSWYEKRSIMDEFFLTSLLLKNLLRLEWEKEKVRLNILWQL